MDAQADLMKVTTDKRQKEVWALAFKLHACYCDCGGFGVEDEGLAAYVVDKVLPRQEPCQDVIHCSGKETNHVED